METTTLILRELIAALWLAASGFLALLFLVYVHRNRGRDLDRSESDAEHQITMRAAIAFVLYFGGATVSRFWGWLNLRFLLFGDYPDIMDTTYPVAAIGSLISLAGAIWLTAIFSPSRWGHWGWISAILFGLAFVAVTRLIGGTV